MVNNTDNQDEREYIEALMIDALDGTLSKSAERELNRYLANNPELAQELDALQAVESLFETPQLVEPPAAFVDNTMAHLPNYTVRRWTTGLISALIIVGSLAPLAIITYLLSSMPVQPAILQMTEAVLSGMAQIVAGAASQPLTFGIPAVMLASIFLWFALYRRMVGNLISAGS